MLKKIITITGKLTVMTSLSIGGNRDDDDNIAVVTNPLTDEPYIPGSSIRGKMRFIFETNGFGHSQHGEPCMCGQKDCIVCRLFGAHNNNHAQSGRSRLIVRDAQLTSDFKKLNKSDIVVKRPVPMKSSEAKKARLREWLIPGTEFDYEIAILIHDCDDEVELLSATEKGLKRIEKSGLGAGNSSGFGKVDFHIGEDSYHVKSEKFLDL